VYGAAQEDSNATFLREVVNLAKNSPYPILIGDFNFFGFHARKAQASLTIIGPFYSMRSLAAWI
jgi:hypothetical protein